MNRNELLQELETTKAAQLKATLRIDLLVREARSQGIPWEKVARSLGMTRQACWEKWRYVDKFLA